MDATRSCVWWAVLVTLTVLAGCEAVPSAQALPEHAPESRITIPMHEVFPPGSDLFKAGGRETMSRALADIPADASLRVTVYGTNVLIRHTRPEARCRVYEARAAALTKWLRSEMGGEWRVDGVQVEMIEGKAADRRIEIVAVVP